MGSVPPDSELAAPLIPDFVKLDSFAKLFLTTVFNAL
jgi:hypothetical protein